MTPRENSVRRAPSARRELRRILVFCGGLRTEPRYFEGLRHSEYAAGVVLEIRQKRVAPTALVKAAQDFTVAHPDVYDEVWCVVDVDEFRDIAAASRDAHRHGLRMAVSYPCFELWLLLHHSAHRAPAANCDELAAALKKKLPNYDKTRLRFADFSAQVPIAVVNGRALDAGDGAPTNPSTGVWRLVERIISPPDGVT